MIETRETSERKEPGAGILSGELITSPRVRYLVLVALILLGTLLRLDGIFSPHLHSDEALYAGWARLIAVWRDPLLARQVVDKPPLLFYLQALLYPLAGTPAPWVARLPNLAASLLLIPLTARLVWQIYGDRLAALVAALFVAVSPLAVRFSPTAFTDPLLTFFLLAGLVAATHAAGARTRSEPGRRRAPLGPAFWAGLLYGLAVAAKHQALLFLPLYLGVAIIMGWRRRMWMSMVTGFAIVVLSLLVWAALRSGVASLWLQQLSAYGGLRLAWSWELWPRLQGWADLWMTLLGSPVLSFGLILGLPLFLALLIQRQDWGTAWDQLFLLFVIAYVLLHWFVAVPLWDRYLLPLVFLVGIIVGRFIARLLEFTVPPVPLARRWLPPATLALVFLLLIPPALQDAPNTPEVGNGASEVAAWLSGEPSGTVLYDHWFSWQWRYFLLDTGVYVSWFPHPRALAEDLQVFGRRGRRFVALPHDLAADPVRRSVEAAGFALDPVRPASDMTLYRIRPAHPQ